MKVALFGASGAIGQHLGQLYQSKGHQLIACSRTPKAANEHGFDYDKPAELEALCASLANEGPFDRVIIATGLLHDQDLQPEKSFKQLNPDHLNKLMAVNLIGPSLIMKHFLPVMNKTGDRPAVVAALSARVSSISDNQLGGWYGYRSSKAALNMMIKTAAIEMARRNKNLVVCGLHPGTVDSNLSLPFQKNVPEGKLFSPQFSADKLFDVIESRAFDHSGKLFAWDASMIDP